jgi:2-keto-4-pentenoate hydratase/2-oxohepta-3-ene-1,7-dioic acid hydratase in catechol pathway
MRLVSLLEAGEERLGLVYDDAIIDPLVASGDRALFGSALAFIRSGERAIAVAQAIQADEPIVFDPLLSKKLDCEVELAIVIGKAGRHIPVERALDHVFGYTIVNDVTARDRQVRLTPEGMTWYELGSGKAFDSSAPLGPNIVTADEIGDPQKLAVRSRVNGELRQSSNTSNMIWSCAELIHFFSRNFTLKPGMVIITGTPAGTAWSADRELGGKGVTQPGLVPATRYCLPGDVVECEIEKIGVLRNPVAAIEAGSAQVAAE